MSDTLVPDRFSRIRADASRHTESMAGRATCGRSRRFRTCRSSDAFSRWLEQLEGQAADARTDIFAFGAVVYEMARGASLIASILDDDPPAISTHQPLTPPALDRVDVAARPLPGTENAESAFWSSGVPLPASRVL